MQGKKQYTEQLFKTFQLSERVPEDNFYRRLKEAIDLRSLYKATAKHYGTEGQIGQMNSRLFCCEFCHPRSDFFRVTEFATSGVCFF